MIKYLLLSAGFFISLTASAQFSGAFAPANWMTTYQESSSGAAVNTSGAPASVSIQGPSNSDLSFGAIRWSIVLNQTQQIGFDYNITGSDDDGFIVSRNSEPLLNASNNGNGSFTGNFSTGDTLSLIAASGTGVGTAMVVTISNFVATGSTLPVTSSQLSLYSNNGRSALLWETYTEKNNKGFEIQRSYDGNTFETVGFVASKAPDGNSNTSLRYAYDMVPAQSIAYYRYKQSDADNIYYSNIVRANPSGIEKAKVAAVPNPASTTLKFVYEKDILQKNMELKIRLIAISGRTVLYKLMSVAPGRNELALDISGIAPGSYYLNYSNESNDINGSLKVVKQ